MNLLIRNAKLIWGGKPIERQILIENGKIKKIAIRVKEVPEQTYDAEGNFVIPGLIDCHVHFREPGLSHKEDWRTGSRAAAAGGVTTVLDMPNVKPPTLTVKRLERKRKLAAKSIINYGFHFGASAADNIKEIKKAKNVASTKIYMNSTTGNLLIEDLDFIEKIFDASRIITVHAEHKQVEEAVEIAKKTGKRLYLTHLTLKSELEFLKKSKTSNVFCEATPHHLFLSARDMKRLKNFGYMLATWKSEEDQRALWAGINQGLIDAIGTDHAPHLKKEKLVESPPAGVPGVETIVPLLLDAFNKGRISLTKIVELTSKNPAKIFGIKNKGMLKVGYDADLCVIDVNIEKKVRNDKLQTKCGWSPFEGKSLKGWPVCTVVNGNIVFEKGDIFEIKAKGVIYNEL